MRILIVDDDFTSQIFMTKFLSAFGDCDVANNGISAIEMVTKAIDLNDPYQLICLDIMMPKVDGLKTLNLMRGVEKNNSQKKLSPAKIIMTSALNDHQTVDEAYASGCDAYIWKPIEIDNFKDILQKLDLI